MIEIKKLENKEENWPLLLEPWYSFHNNSLSNSCVSGFHTDEGRALLRSCLRDMVQSSDCPVIIAWDNKKEKVAGMSFHQLNHRHEDQNIPYHDRPGTFKYKKFDWAENTLADLRRKTDFYMTHGVKLDLFTRFQVDTCWNLSLLSVLPEYGAQGIGQRITEYSLQIAEEMGAEIVWAYFGSNFSQRIGLKCGFEPVVTSRYEQDYRNYQKMSEVNRNTHKTCVSMVKKL